MYRNNSIINNMVVVLIMLLTASAYSQQSKQILKLKIKDLMTTTEFRKSGMHKLTKDELKNLDEWITVYTIRVAKALNSSLAEATPNIIETHIEGDFEGWEGETIFKLGNGQIWQQSSYDYTYHYAYRPKVIIYKTDSGLYKMKVEGIKETIYVRRIK